MILFILLYLFYFNHITFYFHNSRNLFILTFIKLFQEQELVSFETIQSLTESDLEKVPNICYCN